MLNTIFSTDEKSLRPLCGRAVCVILNDETRYTGILTSCSPSSLTLNSERTHRPVKRKRKAKIQADDIPATQEHPTSNAYWGTLSLEPPNLQNSPIRVIPLAPVKAVIAL
ncbi:hypothetical protein [Cohnella sp.]|uniref:hypothetical protein n=1 Tax=Cohnella sp. TaxID=1883426 RepID=UPI003561D9F3